MVAEKFVDCFCDYYSTAIFNAKMNSDNKARKSSKKAPEFTVINLEAAEDISQRINPIKREITNDRNNSFSYT
jgi:hypothetical protein